ncbi:hypothetical protein [Massilia sp. BHUDP2]|uniref:hypothetical protein n=1 Tax=Massilia sp. BHUDP2 TaxID=3034505 RepID=UPI0039057E55
MDEIYRLCVGNIDRQYMECDFTFGMDCIGDSLKENFSNLYELWQQRNTRDFIKFAPTCARVVFEQSLAILLGRLDPIRFVALIRGAESSDFSLGQRNNSSFNWTKDVLPDVKPPNSGWWSQDSLKQIHRTLLHGQMADYLFESTHALLIPDLTDWTTDYATLPNWITELLTIEAGDRVLGRLRKHATEAYSSLSKGIHFEFLKGSSTSLTKETVESSISDCITVIGTCALYTQFCDIALQKSHREIVLADFVNLLEHFEIER